MPKFSKNTGFKLSQHRPGMVDRQLNIGNKEEACPGTPLHRKTLKGTIKGEANADGTIFIDNSVEPGSAEERAILMHEVKHLTDMKTGRLAYDDNWIKWDGQKYPRKSGKILYNGKWVLEGEKSFPWERH
tara:strand:- start:1790 stop:2179 length:390 start_codon:yes stop_codon:yes gene_type:complete